MIPYPFPARYPILAIFLAIAVSIHVGAQEQPRGVSSKPKAAQNSGLELANPSVQKWEMGIEIQANGSAKGISAIFPIPIDWPEQKVKLLETRKSDNVGRITTRSVGTRKTCRIAVVSIPGLTNGETARATMVFEITRYHIAEPANKDRFRFSKSAKRSQRIYLGTSPFIESTHPRIRAIANELPFDQENDWQKVESIFDWVRENIKYEFDEKIRSCIEALDNYQGDCEELSSLFIAICRAKGIPARAVWIPGHTYPEFFLENDKGQGVWLPCQVAGGNHDFGRMPEYKPILQKGDQFRIPGHSKTQRYARPTLTARSAKGSPSLRWIVEPVKE